MGLNNEQDKLFLKHEKLLQERRTWLKEKAEEDKNAPTKPLSPAIHFGIWTTWGGPNLILESSNPNHKKAQELIIKVDEAKSTQEANAILETAYQEDFQLIEIALRNSTSENFNSLIGPFLVDRLEVSEPNKKIKH